MSSPFDVVSDISFKKENIFDECEYIPFLVNRSFSYYPDTIFYAAEMNKYSSIENKMQHDFYFNAVSKKKRFAKWVKSATHADISLIQEHYKYSIEKAKQVLPLFSKEQLQVLRDQMNTGGVNTNNGKKE